MRLAFSPVRPLLRSIPRTAPFGRPTSRLPKRHFHFFSHSWRPRPSRHGPTYGRVLFAAANGAALATAAFVQLSEADNGDSETTSELRMLEISREEIAKKVPDDDRGLRRLFHQVTVTLDLWVWEPLCTGFRFLHLVVIFVPVIASVPAIWIGRRVPERDNERTGALWWYGFLVRCMELAGPAFIKVSSPRFSSA